MRPLLFVAGLSLALAAASAAEAQSGCAAAAHNRRVTGTVVGALAGGLLGNAVSGHGSKGTGTLVGAGLGAVAGNQLSRTSCDHYAYRSTRHRYARASTRTYAPGYAGAYGQNASAYAPVGSARYAASSASCHYVSRPYYDQAGRLLYAPMQVCD
jgi:uncharacterized protein YcfJ